MEVLYLRVIRCRYTRGWRFHFKEGCEWFKAPLSQNSSDTESDGHLYNIWQAQTWSIVTRKGKIEVESLSDLPKIYTISSNFLNARVSLTKSQRRRVRKNEDMQVFIYNVMDKRYAKLMKQGREKTVECVDKEKIIAADTQTTLPRLESPKMQQLSTTSASSVEEPHEPQKSELFHFQEEAVEESLPVVTSAVEIPSHTTPLNFESSRGQQISTTSLSGVETSHEPQNSDPDPLMETVVEELLPAVTSAVETQSHTTLLNVESSSVHESSTTPASVVEVSHESQNSESDSLTEADQNRTDQNRQ